MKYINIVEQLEFFDLSTFKELVTLQSRSIYKFVKRRVEDSTFIQLKKGLYTTTSFVNTNNTVRYKEKIANKLKSPSYLSLEYMLDKYSILSENAYAFTSISTKKTNSYTNILGSYYYKNIKKTLFKGYLLEGDVYYASKAKSLFDYLYFKKKDIDISSMRLNMDEISDDDLNEFKTYCENEPKMLSIYVKLVNYKKDVS